MIFVLAMLFTFVYDRKNENHWSLFITRYSKYKHPKLLILKSVECNGHAQL